jgi:hypothetical protein
VRDLFVGNSLLVSAHYPIELQHHFLEVFASVMKGETEAQLRVMGAEVAETDLRGIYRVFIWVASVQQTLTVLTKVWNSYFSTGNASWISESSHSGVVRITDRYQHPLHYPIVAAYIEVAIGLAGGREASVKVDQARDDAVSFRCTWRDQPLQIARLLSRSA